MVGNVSLVGHQVWQCSNPQCGQVLGVVVAVEGKEPQLWPSTAVAYSLSGVPYGYRAQCPGCGHWQTVAKPAGD